MSRPGVIVVATGTADDADRLTKLGVAFSVGAAVLGAVRTTTNRGSVMTDQHVLAPEQMTGPYYVERSLLRSDIQEQQPGVPMTLEIQVVRAGTGHPLADIAVDIWHCDAVGVYSGYTEYVGNLIPELDENLNAKPTDDQTHLRGVQFTDANGIARFHTIVPGWYTMRTVHIHVKTIVGATVDGNEVTGGQVSHTGQLYIPEDLIARISALEPYTSNFISRVANNDDSLYGQEGVGTASMLTITETDGAVHGAIVVAIDPGIAPPPAPVPAFLADLAGLPQLGTDGGTGFADDLPSVSS